MTKKEKGKRSSGASEAVLDRGMAVPDTQATPSVPQLDESAFAGLRQKIEQRLKGQSSGKVKSNKNSKPQVPAKQALAKKGKEAISKPNKSRETAQGKKRDHHGEVIARDEKNGGKNKERKSGSSKNDADETLRQEILALGGTEEDFDLLAGVDSESEVEDAPATSKKGSEDALRKELSKMLHAAGQVVPQDLEDEEVDEDEEDEEEQDNDSEEDNEHTSASEQEITDVEEELPAEPAPRNSKTATNKSKEPEIVVPKEYAKLVSDGHHCFKSDMLTLFLFRSSLPGPIGTPLLSRRLPVQSK